MNAYCNDFSNKNTYAAGDLPATVNEGLHGSKVITHTTAARNRIAAFIDKLLSLLDRLIGALSSSKALAIIRTSVSVICFFAVIGIIGGIESGAIGWVSGSASTVATATVEAICIKKCK